jgi:hypothetical protein
MSSKNILKMDNKLYIGIDISLNSTGICFNYKNKQEFISISSKICYTTSKKKTTEEIVKDSYIRNGFIQRQIASSLNGISLRENWRKTRKKKTNRYCMEFTKCCPM